MNTTPSYPRPDLPEELAVLRELALDLRWSWSHVADELWRRIDRELWRRTHNPWLILQVVSRKHLQRLAADPDFMALLATIREEQCACYEAPTWFRQTWPDARLGGVAYFSMEFGLSEALPLYSGGLGVLAGDHLKTASELGVPVTGIGLLYQQGYFRQGLDADGRQLVFFPYNEPSQLPVIPVRDEDGEWLRIKISLPGRPLWLRIWQVQVGRVQLYLLDSNDPLNTPVDRGITSELYGGGTELRLQQEIVLGIGGYRILAALEQAPDVCHLNEGHAALVVLERTRHFMQTRKVDFHTALTATRAGNLFTTHTSVESGFDRFTPALIEQYLGEYAYSLGLTLPELLSLGQTRRANPDGDFHMSWLAIRGCGAINGVSQLHGEVSRTIFQPLFPRWPRHEVPVAHVTNGVHVPSWDSPEADRLWTAACGKERWRQQLGGITDNIRNIPDDQLWDMRSHSRKRLIDWIRDNIPYQQSMYGVPPDHRISPETTLDSDTLTLGFARRFVSYKRPNLLLHDPDRLAQLLRNPAQSVQLIIAGKAHPRDRAGQALIQAWIRFIRDYRLEHRVVFLVDYDLLIAEHLVQGVDLWINTPRRPWEACGTSGMKVLVNGGMNLSELDGWWAEAYRPETGWALGDGRVHDADPAWDAQEAGELYDLLEQKIIPDFYQRNDKGIPTRWVNRMRTSMAELTPRFSSNRMLREYTETCYLKLARAFQERSRNRAALARELEQWHASLEAHWATLHFGQLEIVQSENRYRFTIQIYLGDLDADAIRVELYADPLEKEEPERHRMEAVEHLAGTIHGFSYRAEIAATRAASDYSVRIVPYHPAASIPLEANRILWSR